MNVNVIITPKDVYATYYETICFRQTFSEDYLENCQAKDTARAYAFRYAACGKSCILQELEVTTNWDDNDVFNFLSTQQK